MSDEDLAGRLRAAVTGEAGRAGDDGLADRLLAGTARAGRARRTGALAVAAVAVVGVVGVTVLVAGGEDTLSGGDVAGAPDDGAAMSVREAGAVTVEQAAREGVDGTAECESDAVHAFPQEGAGVERGLELYAAYLTDADGYEQWTAEYSGEGIAFAEDGADVRSLLAICWFTGDVPEDGSVGRPSSPMTHQVVVLQLEGPSGTAGLRLDGRSPRPLPVLAPPVPADAPAGAQLRAFPQPDGVPVLDELPLRPAPVEPPERVDCTAIACVDPNEEVVVRADTLVDGQPVDPSGYRELAPGQPVTLRLVLDVEPGQTITDVHFALSENGHGLGPDGPLGLGEVFARESTVTGTRTFETTWTVPELAQAQQLVLTYRFDKYQDGAGHARTLGGVTVPGAAPYG